MYLVHSISLSPYESYVSNNSDIIFSIQNRLSILRPILYLYVNSSFRTAFFGVYKCSGPGAAAVKGVSWAHELDYDTAHKFLAKSFVNGRHWIDPSDA